MTVASKVKKVKVNYHKSKDDSDPLPKKCSKKAVSTPKVTDECTGRLNRIVPDWHDNIKFEYYYHPVSRQLKATIGILKQGKKLFISYAIVSPKEKNISKDKARFILSQRLESFAHTYEHDSRYGASNVRKNPMTPIFCIQDYEKFFSEFEVNDFKDILNLMLDDVFAKLDDMGNTDGIQQKKNFIFHVKKVFLDFFPKFYLKHHASTLSWASMSLKPKSKVFHIRKK